KSQNDVNEFDDQMSRNLALKNQFGNFVRRVGGNSLMGVTRRVILLVLSRDLVRQFSWAGRTKRAFKRLLISDIIIGVVTAIFSNI
ncbi:unnamed protein product, partial [Allacma fusca]